MRIDINCDLGEGAGLERRKLDRELMKYVTSANIAGGVHSGSPAIMRRSILWAKKYGVAIGIHPGFPDRAGFGRGDLKLTPAEISDYVAYQIGALEALAKAEGMKIRHLKLHGALYHLANSHKPTARAVAETVKRINRNLWILTLPNSQLAQACCDFGLRCAREAFADRAYTADGRLVARDKPGALITSPKEVCNRVLKLLATGKITSIEKKEIIIGPVDTICLHSDTPDTVVIARALNKALTKAGIIVSSLA